MDENYLIPRVESIIFFFQSPLLVCSARTY